MTTSTAPATPAQTTVRYQRGDFLFATARRALLARGALGTVTDADPRRLARSAAAELDRSGVPLAVGVLPFDTGPGAASPGHLVLPRTVHRAQADAETPAVPPAADLPAPAATRRLPSAEGHRENVRAAVAALRDRDLRKAVLARALELEFDAPIPVEGIVRNLARGNPRHFTYAAELPGGRTLVGATPELLLSRTGDSVFTTPHAGSMPRSADPETDRANGEALLASAKDREEHDLVIDYVVESLRPFCRKLDVPAGPELVSTPAIWHLRTSITGELTDRSVTALDLAAAMHPTPAVCGTPTVAARDLVKELEPFDRGYYAGAVGWVDAAGDGEWAVAIRCAEVAETSMRLFAGGGIVPASDPDTEYQETIAKFRTLLGAMGLDDSAS
ncbi:MULTISPECIES: isochorismate synthase [Amycolatopsis]|uniref:isochorismate synthase n=1 Tax=Amycolatopsis dendrobii TaxID=2760662 RepID=A0A7W3Z8F9_9PSEU|nr:MULTISPECIES: isochorismate synthase [Amycolatopsis]MBB1152351.1 isochorismate synthase [Amycolatopsis dendrobii]UKD52400.1 isochorismate synthase [Amycolatopsis sp. FU40]